MSDRYSDELGDFVGRKLVLEALEELANSTHKKSKLILISGEGGVGKTFLSRYFYDKIKKDTAFFSLDYDFDSYYFHDAESLRLSISHKWGMLSFNEYLQVYNIIKTEAKGNRAFKKHLHEEATEKWLTTLKSADKRIVFFFDTLDALSNIQIDNIGQYFFSILPENSLFIISGRQDAIKQLEQSIKEVSLSILKDALKINLQPLKDDEFDEFIDVKLKKLGYSSYEDLPKKEVLGGAEGYLRFIKKASKGLPILLGLSLEPFLSPSTERYASYIKDINFLIKKDSDVSLSESELETKFKHILIRHFLNNHSNQLKELVLALAHAWPMGKVAIEEVLELEDSAECLMEEARTTSYIKRIPNGLSGTEMDVAQSKYFLSLQDVMREMINTYAWEELDSDTELRSNVSKTFLGRLKKTIERGEEKINKAVAIMEGKKSKKEELVINTDQYILSLLLQRLKVQTVRHTTCLDIKEGLRLYDRLLGDKDLNKYNTESQYIDELSRHLEDMIKTFHRKEMVQLLKSEDDELQALLVNYYTRRLKFLVSRNRLKEATEIENGIESNGDKLSFELRTLLFEEIASYYLKDGKLQIGLELLKNLKKICDEEIAASEGPIGKKTPLKLLFHLFTTMGWAYRLIGDIQKSDESYAYADDLLVDYDLLPGVDIEIVDVAMLYQTWAYVKALEGEERIAKDFIGIAYSKYKEVDSKEGIGRVESVSGRIRIEFDEYDAAIEHFESARDIFSEDNLEWQSKVLLGLANAHVLRSEASEKLTDEQRKADLDLACDYIKVVEEWDFPAERSEAHYVSGNIYLRQRDYKGAEKYYQKAWDISKSQGSIYYLHRSLIGRMRVVIFNKLNGRDSLTSCDFESIHEDMLKDWNEMNNDILGDAIFYCTLGSLKFLESDPSEALKLYKQYLPIIAKHGRFYAISVKGQLNRMKEIFIDFSTTKLGKIDENKLEVVHDLALKLWKFWKEKGYSRQYRKANPIIRSWISGNLNEWNHPDDGIINKSMENNYGE